jgi:hypothetical protein
VQRDGLELLVRLARLERRRKRQIVGGGGEFGLTGGGAKQGKARAAVARQGLGHAGARARGLK